MRHGTDEYLSLTSKATQSVCKRYKKTTNTKDSSKVSSGILFKTLCFPLIFKLMKSKGANVA